MIRYLCQSRKKVAFTVILILAETACQTLAATILAKLLDTAIQKDFSKCIQIFTLNVLLYVLYLSTNHWSNKVRIDTVQNLILKYRTDTIQYLSNCSFSEYSKKSEATYLNWLNNDALLIEQNGFDSLFSIIESIFLVVLSAVSLFQFHSALMFLTLLLSMLILTLPNIPCLKKALQNSQKNFSNGTAKFSSAIVDWTSGFSDLFQQGRMDFFRKNLFNASQEIGQATKQYKYLQNRMSSLICLLNVTSQLFVSLMTVIFVLNGNISAGSLLSVGQLSGSVFNNLDNISNTISRVASISPLLKEKKHENISLCTKIPRDSNTIKMENVNYYYNNIPVFGEDLNIKFEKGKKYAIVGASGSGKSTLVNILCGNFKDYHGSIKFGDVELRDINDRWLRSFLILMQQHPHLFDLSVEENIFLGEKHSDNEFNSILKETFLDAVVPECVGERQSGSSGEKPKLSGGQQQRVFLARILASQRKFIIFDESTSAQDPRHAYLIENRLLSDPSLTVIMITHHLNPELKTKFNSIITL